MCPLPPAALFQRPARRRASHTPPRLTFQMPARRCASHTPPCLTFQTRTRRCATHTPSRLACQMRTSGVQPTHRSVQAFFIGPKRWGGFFPVTARTRRREVHTPPRSRSIIPPGDSLSTTGRCDIHHTAPISFRLTPPMMGGFSFLQPRRWGRCDTHTPPPVLLRLSPPILGGILRVVSATGAAWYPHAVPVLLHLPPLNNGGFFNVN